MFKNIKMEFNGDTFTVEAERIGNNIVICRDGKKYSVQIIPEETAAAKAPLPKTAARTASIAPRSEEPSLPANAGESIKAPMTGMVKDILVQTGAKVKASQIVMIMEAMKMDIEIKALAEGTVKEIYAAANSNVTQAQPLMSIG